MSLQAVILTHNTVRYVNSYSDWGFAAWRTYQADLLVPFSKQELIPMRELIEFPLEAGGTVFIEVESDPVEGLIPASPLTSVPQKAQETFETALGRVGSLASVVLQKLKSIPEAPDQVEVEFGIKMDAAAGVILSSAGVEANFKIALTWKKATPPTQPQILSSAQ